MSDELINGWWTAAEALDRVPQLRGARLVWKDYAPPSERWDHDHCALCSTKLMAPKRGRAPDTLTAGYTDGIKHQRSPTAIIETGPVLEGAPSGTMTWVCPVCADTYRKVFNWTTEGGPRDVPRG
jgi:hypothetical protein